MKNLVNALLNVSRIDLGALAINPKPVFLHETLHDVLQELRPFTVQKKIRIVTKVSKDLPTIFLDPNLIHIVFQNLIGNAVKYTPEKGSVSIHIYQKNGLFQILVSDTGYGIPEHQQEKIFSKLFRADNVQKKRSMAMVLVSILRSLLWRNLEELFCSHRKKILELRLPFLSPKRELQSRKRGNTLIFQKPVVFLPDLSPTILVMKLEYCLGNNNSRSIQKPFFLSKGSWEKEFFEGSLYPISEEKFQSIPKNRCSC